MGKVHVVDFNNRRKRNYENDICSGCQKVIREDEEFTELIVPYGDCDQHIALCNSCSKTAREYGVL